MIYRASVVHRRLASPSTRFVYRVFSILVDVDRLDVDVRRTRLLSHNRFNLLSIHDRDHGPRDGTALRPWAERLLARHGIELEGGRIRLLCFPRVLGYTFDPLSVWFCEHRDGTLRAVLCEVRNTFGESHVYLLAEGGRPLRAPVRSSATKVFHVSPFLDVAGEYTFRISAPGDRLDIGIRLARGGEPLLVAAYRGNAEPLRDAALVRALARMPLMTLKVMAMIHWEALKLWLRGARVRRKPSPPVDEVTT
ncbi:MAG: DUF1365 domain-containing protein [Ectothiorhodospiraceae bacterium]|nr:DUF1365 domain-containing protein [Ectothiorhodospiraceae bacterium]